MRGTYARQTFGKAFETHFNRGKSIKELKGEEMVYKPGSMPGG